MHHKGKVVSRTELIEHIYDQDFDRDSNTIEVFVTRIRKKLGRRRHHHHPRPRLQPRGPGEREQAAAPVTAAAEAAAGRRGARASAAHRVADPAHHRRRGVVDRGAAADRRLRARPRAVALDRRQFRQPAGAASSTSMIAASEIGPDGEVRFNRPPADQRFIEPYSGLYFQISGAGADTFASRSLWDRRLRVTGDHNDVKPHLYDSNEFRARRCRAAAHRRARRDPARIEDPLALPGRAVARDDRRPDPPPPLDPVLELPRARRRAARAGRAADLLRPVAAAPRPARSRLDPLGREDPHQPGFPDRNPPADRGDQPAARA